MDGGAWWATVHGVSKSQTRLSDFTWTFHFHALEKEMATHSRVLAWRIPGMAEPGGLPSVGSHRVRHGWRDLAAACFPILFSTEVICFFYFSKWLLFSCVQVWDLVQYRVYETLYFFRLKSYGMWYIQHITVTYLSKKKHVTINTGISLLWKSFQVHQCFKNQLCVIQMWEWVICQKEKLCSK